jgi:hypothetical protein
VLGLLWFEEEGNARKAGEMRKRHCWKAKRDRTFNNCQ